MTAAMESGRVVAVSRSAKHEFSKSQLETIGLIKGRGVDGDCHAGVTVQHLSRIRRDPTQPNLRQVYLLATELHEELMTAGYDVRPGDLGENILTAGIDLLALPTRTRLTFASGAVVEVTGLRNPCVQIDRFKAGLLGHVVGRTEGGDIVRRAGVMGVVLEAGAVRVGEQVMVTFPVGAPVPLRPV